MKMQNSSPAFKHSGNSEIFYFHIAAIQSFLEHDVIYSGISPTHGMLTFSLVFNFEEFFPNLLRPQLSDSEKLWKWKEICFAGLELFYIGQFINIFSAINFNCKFRECIEINSRSNNMNIIN